MDYYTESLLRGVIANSGEAYLYSNFTANDSAISSLNLFDGHVSSNAFIRLFRLIKALFISAYSAKRHSVDLTIIHLFSADSVSLLLLLIPKLFFLNIAVIVHDVTSFANNDNKWVQLLIYKYLANYIIVHNQYSYDAFASQALFSKHNLAKKMHIIKHGGYLDYIKKPIDKTLARKQLSLAKDEQYLLFFGQIKKVKGLDILLKALVKTPTNIKLIIAGKPWKDDFLSYQQQIDALGLSDRVILDIGFIEDEKRALYFYAADANVLPYRIIFQSGVLLMAMSYGLPVIASNLPANAEIITHEKNGLLFTTENSDDLATCITRFFTNANFSKTLSSSALDTITNDYNWTTIAEQYLQLSNKV